MLLQQRTVRVSIEYTCKHLFGYALVHVIYSRVSGQYSHAVLQTNIDQKLINSLHGLLNCEIGGLDYRVITTEYKTRVHCIHMYHLFCYALVHVIYSRVSCQCSHAVQGCLISNECYMSGCVQRICLHTNLFCSKFVDFLI